MKNYIRLFLSGLFYLSLTNLFAQSQLTIAITHIKNNKGIIILELIGADHQSLLIKEGIIKDNTCTIIIDNLKNAKYAARYFHDENLNEQLDKNWMGIPIEGYGFSNNAYGSFGPKDFKEWLFDVNGNTKIYLKTK